MQIRCTVYVSQRQFNFPKLLILAHHEKHKGIIKPFRLIEKPAASRPRTPKNEVEEEGKEEE